MTRPIFFGTETDIAVLILALKVIAKGIPTSFGLLFIEAAARKDTTNGFNPHHIRSQPRSVVDVALARNVVDPLLGLANAVPFGQLRKLRAPVDAAISTNEQSLAVYRFFRTCLCAGMIAGGGRGE